MPKSYPRTTIIRVWDERKAVEDGYGRRKFLAKDHVLFRRITRGRRTGDKAFMELPRDRRLVMDDGLGRRVHNMYFVHGLHPRRRNSKSGRRKGDQIFNAVLKCAKDRRKGSDGYGRRKANGISQSRRYTARGTGRRKGDKSHVLLPSAFVTSNSYYTVECSDGYVSFFGIIGDCSSVIIGGEDPVKFNTMAEAMDAAKVLTDIGKVPTIKKVTE